MFTQKIDNGTGVVIVSMQDLNEPMNGSSGRRGIGARYTVADVMLDISLVPVLPERALLKETLEEMSRLNLGIACLTNKDGILTGIITDGDIRRKLLRTQKPFSAFLVDDAVDHAIKSPAAIGSAATLDYAVEVMGQRQIWDLPVVASDGELKGLLHLHPAIKVLLREPNYE